MASFCGVSRGGIIRDMYDMEDGDGRHHFAVYVMQICGVKCLILLQNFLRKFLKDHKGKKDFLKMLSEQLGMACTCKHEVQKQGTILLHD